MTSPATQKSQPVAEPVTLELLTSASPGAVAIIQIQGRGVMSLLTKLTGKSQWTGRRAMLVDFAGIDHGLVLLWRNDWAQLMPHGGPRVVQKIIDELIQLGATTSPTHPSTLQAHRLCYPEAANALEADMLATLALAASPAAVDLLLAQPTLWADAIQRFDAMTSKDRRTAFDEILRQSSILNRLIHPPTIAIVGKPNVGKSTLTNAMLGSSASIVADLPGTTRDWVAGMTQLPTPAGGLAVRWLDTPGVHQSDDVIEQQAIAMSHGVIAQSDIVVALRDPVTPWAEGFGTRQPDLWVMNKIDTLQHDDAMALAGDQLQGQDKDWPMLICATSGQGLDTLATRLTQLLLGDDLSMLTSQCLWAFDDTLREALTHDDLAAIHAVTSLD